MAFNPSDDIEIHGSDLTGADVKRLSSSKWRTFDVMKDGEWRTFDRITAEILRRTGENDRPSTVERMVRYLRDLEGWTVEKQRDGDGGVWEYRLVQEGAVDV